MKFLTKKQILSVQDLSIEKVDIPAWGGYVYVRPLSSRDRDRWESEIALDRNSTFDNMRAKLAARSICDEAGELLFTEEDIEALGNKSAQAMDTIFDRLLSINKIDDQTIGEITGN